MNYRIVHFDTIDSTNTYACTLAKQDTAEGLVIVSDYQTKGRGRFRRRWRSPRGRDLLFSIVLRPHCTVNAMPLITHVAAMAVKETMERHAAVSCVLKKPNDVLIAGKKVSGILTELHSAGNRVDFCVVGVGMNVNSLRRHLVNGATSLCEETGATYDRDIMLETYLKLFAKKYKAFVKK